MLLFRPKKKSTKRKAKPAGAASLSWVEVAIGKQPISRLVTLDEEFWVVGGNVDGTFSLFWSIRQDGRRTSLS